jgi:hypothetical protein
MWAGKRLPSLFFIIWSLIMQSQLGHKTRVIEGLIHSLKSEHTALTIQEQLNRGYEYVLRDVRLPTTNDEQAVQRHFLNERLLEVLFPALISPGPELVKRMLGRVTCNISANGANLPLLDCEWTNDGDGKILSDVFGIEVRVKKLGKNLAFSVSSKSGVPHEVVEGALAKNNHWKKRISEIAITVRRQCFGEVYTHAERNCSVHPYQVLDLVPPMLKYVPGIKNESFTPKDFFRSFDDDKNPGVKVCTLYGMPVYARLVPDYEVPKEQDGNGEKRWRKVQATGYDDKSVILRTADIHLEFVVKSVADPFDFKNDDNVDYYNEQVEMQGVAEQLFIGLRSYVAEADKKSLT